MNRMFVTMLAGFDEIGRWLTDVAGSPSGSVLLGAIIGGVFALLGGFGGAVLVAQKTGGLITATKELAAATKATVAEIQRDRELEYRPYLSWEAFEEPTSQTSRQWQARASNLGRGPLINCLCCQCWTKENSPNLATTDLFNLAPAGGFHMSEEMPFARRSGMMAVEEVVGNPLPQSPAMACVGFGCDQLGLYYRFRPHHSPDTWREGQGDQPLWVKFYLYHLDLFRKGRPDG